MFGTIIVPIDLACRSCIPYAIDLASRALGGMPATPSAIFYRYHAIYRRSEVVLVDV